MNKEEFDDDGLGMMRGLFNAFIIMLLACMIFGTIWGLTQK